MRWKLSHRADPAALPIADRHYNRQKPGTPQFVPPGRCVVLLTDNESALWVTSWPYAKYVKHAWPGAWVNSCFRNEGDYIASELIREAIAATRYIWPDAPELGMVTFIDSKKVKPIMRRGKKFWGYVYLKAGFERASPPKTKGGLLAFQILPADMPESEPPLGMQLKMDLTTATR